jgi:hypothetical protein
MQHSSKHNVHELKETQVMSQHSPALLTPATRAGVEQPAMGGNTTGLDMPSY